MANVFKIKTFIQELKTKYLQTFQYRRLPNNKKQAVISFTFDDVPRSAFNNAVPILNKHDIKATFYVAMGLTNDTCDEQEGYLRPDEIIKLHQLGHNIACHTYEHYMLDAGSAQELAADSKKNVASLKKLLGLEQIEHFSYPFGQVNFSLKKMLAKEYKTMRSSRPGINLKKTDLNLLKATSIYSPSFNKKNLQKLIEQTIAEHGWLILYTHGVNEHPDNYSCTPEQLAWVVDECRKSSAKILSISDAYQYLTENI